MQLWPHQQRGVEQVNAAIADGCRRICVTSPTGTGKTRMVAAMIRSWLDQGARVLWYSNRVLLLAQTSGVLDEYGLRHGIIAAGYPEDFDIPFQIASIATMDARTRRTKRMELWPATHVVVDEAHIQTGPHSVQLLNQHWENKAVIVGVTATPVDVGFYDRLIVAGTMAEGFRCQALLPAAVFGPDEPDFKAMKKKPAEGEDFSESQAVAAMMRPGLFGRVWEWYEKLNPGRLPTILFGPGVKESIWFAEQFRAKGVPAAHIDGEHISYGEKDADGASIVIKTTPELRDSVIEKSRTGEIQVLCNRFVLREGIDCPWLAHAILATCFGSVSSYLQSVGRLLRYFPGYTRKVIQDHGGNWLRHGSPNVDRDWFPGITSGMAYGLRAERIRSAAEPKPRRCPKCAQIVAGNVLTCPCGYVLGSRTFSRPVVTASGQLREMTGDGFAPRRIARPSLRDTWIKMYYRSRNTDRTFRAAAALFSQENSYAWPDPTWPLMPKNEIDWFRRVKDVPKENLT